VQEFAQHGKREDTKGCPTTIPSEHQEVIETYKMGALMLATPLLLTACGGGGGGGGEETKNVIEETVMKTQPTVVEKTVMETVPVEQETVIQEETTDPGTKD
jgi:hypothetical protein